MTAAAASRTTPTGRIVSSIADARNAKGVALLPFVAGGFPDMATTVETLKALDQPGVGAIEVGFPFSDPIADGSVIQEAFADALAHGFHVANLFVALKAAKHDIAKPLVAMVSFSIVYRYGLERFLTDAKAAGFTGMLFPDLPPPEAQSVCEKVVAAGLETVLLVAPTTSPKRRAEIAKLCTGFVYYMSVSGITGERSSLPADLEANICQLKSLASVPVCVGFGISKREHVKQLQGIGDGAIVGSGVVRRAQAVRGDGAETIAQTIRAYCDELIG